MESLINKKSRRTVYFVLFLLCIFILAGSILWWSLKKGIEFDRVSFASTEIKQLSLQLDQGLIIHVGQINIKATGTAAGNANFETWILRIKKWGHLIQEINISRISYRNHTIAITYRDGDFQIRGDEFTLEAQASYDMGAFYFDLGWLEIKPYKLILSGEASYARKEDRFLFSGVFNSPWGNGKLRIKEKKQQIEAQISTEKFTDLVALLKHFPLDEEIIAWISDNISARSYQVNQLHLQFSLNKLQDIGPENINGFAIADTAAIQFHPDLPPVQCDRIKITFQDDRLSFAIENPMYRGKKLEGSNVYIDNIIMPHSVLAIHIKTESRMDDIILNLLEKYDFNLPLRQLSGLTRAEIDLLFDLPKFTLKTNGIFTTGSGAWTWSDIALQTQGASVQLEDDRITIKQAEISYKDILHTRLSGLIDTSSMHASLENEIEQLDFAAKGTTILQAARFKLPLDIDYSNEAVLIDLDQIKTSITLDSQGATIDIGSLAAVTPLVPSLQSLPFSSGNVHLAFKDITNFEFTGKLDFPNSVLTLKDKPVTLFQFQGTSTPEKTEVSVNDDRILMNISDRAKITLNEYLVTVDFNILSNENKTPSLPLPLEISGPQTLLQVKDLQVPTNDFEFKVSGTDMTFAAELEKGHIEFKSTGQKMKLIGTGLDAQLADKFIPSTDLSEGLISVNLDGDAEGYNGYLKFSNVIIREYLIMNNLFAFLNSIPALATLSEPGFDNDGYRVKEGIVHFDLQDKLLTIRQLRTDGTAVNCEARGWLDFDQRTLKLNMELITLKDYSKIIDVLPWAGYAILGEDGSLSTSLKVDGSLDDPVIETYVARDLIMTPVNIIRRTIKWPFKIFSDMGEDEPEPSERVTPSPMVPK